MLKIYSIIYIRYPVNAQLLRPRKNLHYVGLGQIYKVVHARKFTDRGIYSVYSAPGCEGAYLSV